MARQILPIVGAIVGGIYGGPTGAQAGWALGSVVGGVVDPVVNKGPSLGDLPAQTSYEGSPRAIIYGTATCVGYIAAFGEPIKSTETEGGDKGGPQTEVEVVHRSYAIAICEGPIGGILRVWENDKLVYDIRPESEIVEDSEKWLSEGDKEFYLGTESQLPDTLLETALEEVGELPAFRGTAYMRVIAEDLTDTRGAIPQYRFEVAKAVNPVTVSLPTVLARNFIAGVSGGGVTASAETSNGTAGGSGSVFLVDFGFGSLNAGYNLILEVLIDDGVVWSKSFITTGPLAGSIKVQINKDPGFSIKARWRWADGLTHGLINYGIHVMGVKSPVGRQVAYRGGESEIPLIYESDNPYFGVGVDGLGNFGSLYARSDDNTIQIPWGPPTLQIGVEGASQPLSTIVDDLHLRSSVDSDDYDTSELEDIDVRGLTLQSDGYTAADAISQLQSCYFFDKQEPGDRVYYPLRGKPVVATLTIDDLVETPDLSRREQASEIPKKVNLMYQNSLAGYAPVKATFSASSPDNKSVLEVTTQVAVVLDVDEAAQMANKIFKVATSDAQGEIKISVPDRFMRFVPGDAIGLVIRERVIRLRIESIEWASGVLNITCRTDRQSAYTSNITGIAIPPPVNPPSSIAGTTKFAFLDIPARIESEDDLHYLVAGTGARDGWRGWALQRSLDAGANFATVESWNDRAVMGALVDPVPAASEHYTDTTNTVRVQLYRTSQVIESLTETQFLSEGGAFAIIKPDGSAEVMQYLDAEDEGDGVFALTTLHRGLLNTGGSSHLAGALFVMLQSAKHVTAQSSWIGQSLVHRGVSISESAETATPETDAFVGRSQIEWPVEYLQITRDSGGLISGSWAARHRFGSDVAPIASANFMGYRVVFDDGVNISTLSDTFDTSFELNYAVIGEPATVTVYPINRITGRGPGVSVVV